VNVITCSECSKDFEAEVTPRRGAICFACHIKTIRLGFTHGKADFHGPTIKERQDKQISNARAAGLDPQPVGSRWV
jgi:hypothetical protein